MRFNQARQIAIPATYMRGGTSKGVFFTPDDLHAASGGDKDRRDRILLRIIGSPDPYGKHTDGMGGATSSTSKVVIVGPSTQAGCDVDYLFGQVSIDQPFIDWSGNCGNLTTAVGPFAIARGLVRAPRDGMATVRIWQANIGKKIIAHVPMQDGEVLELGDFELDGVAFPAAEVKLEFLDPGAGEENAPAGGAADSTMASGSGMFPTGNRIDSLDIPGLGKIEATLIDAGLPTIFVEAASLGLTGRELQEDLNNDAEKLARIETLRSHGAVAMGLARTPQESTQLRPHTPKVSFIARAAAYTSSSGKAIAANEVDLLARVVSMGKLHHAMTGTGAVAIAVASAVPGTIVHRLLDGQARASVRFGHPSGTLQVGAVAEQADGQWTVKKALMSRSARRLMTGTVWVPSAVL